MTHAIGSLFSGYGGLRIGSLFSGMGGLDLAVESVTGAQPAWFCEWEDAPSKVLARHYPDVPNHRDVTAVDWEQVEPVDIITGGSPCQDLSAAGKRAGMTEGTRSNLWVNMREAIATIRPRLVVWENVLGALSATATSDSDMEPGEGQVGNGGGGHLRALGRVLGDLTEIGYDAAWTTVRASDVGAPHHRARVFLIATPTDTYVVGSQAGYQRTVGSGPEVPVTDRRGGPLPHTISPGRDERGGTAPGQAASGRTHSEPDRCGDGIHWGDYAPAVRRWERATRPAPAPTELNRNGKPRLNPEFASWMMGLPAGHVTSVPGLSRTDMLKMIGNGVCPPQAAAALLQLLEIMDKQEMVTSHDPR